MKMMHGAFSRALLKMSRTIRGPSPNHFCTNSLATTWMKFAVVAFATAFASMVLPVPGGPYISTYGEANCRIAYSARRVDSNLREDLGMKKGELHRFTQFLLLDIETSNVLICNGRLFCHNLNVVVRLRGEDVHHSA